MPTFDEIVKYSKYFITFSIPVLYLQGIAHYQGKLSAYGIKYGLYPLSFEESLSEAYIFYLESVTYIFYFALGWLGTALLFSYLSTKLSKIGKTKIQKWLENIFIKIFRLFTRNKFDFIAPGLLLFSIYAIFALGFSIAIPFGIAQHNHKQKFQKIISEYPENTESIYLIESNCEEHKEVVILQTTKNFISFYYNNSVFTYPVSKVSKIEHKITNKTQRIRLGRESGANHDL